MTEFESKSDKADLRSTVPAVEPRPLVLLVEHDVATRKLMSRVVTRLNYSIHEATSIAAAVKYLGAYHYDLILLDTHLHDGEGAEIARLIRLDECDKLEAPGGAPRLPAPRVPIIALSTDDDRRTVEGMMNAGVDMYVRKPFTPGDLSQILLKYLPQ